ncbi:MAG TPA: hypothetical protein VEM76_03710 [Anaeromyxobacteraceae bacterium]|nr:hypothetical protein [Anaeromyxobacteraceae bacterium]
MRGLAPVLLAVMATGCSTVKLAQRDGCWVRKTERFLIGSKEEVGPCIPPVPKWSEDRLTRLVQECATRADYRWQGRALEAWSRREAMPERSSEEAVLRDCMGETTRAMLSENEAMKQRLGDVGAQRDAMAAERDAVRGQEAEARKQLLATEGETRKQLLASHEKLADYLGQAANKAQAPATATASAKSDSAGTAHTESAHDSQTSLASQSAPGQPVPVVVTTAPSVPPVNAGAARGRPLRKARATPPAARACPPTASATPIPNATRDPLTPTVSPAGGEGGRLSTPTWTPTLTPPSASSSPDPAAAAP